MSAVEDTAATKEEPLMATTEDYGMAEEGIATAKAAEENEQPTTTEEDTTKPKLNHKNYLNVLAYILNIALVYGVGNAGWAGTPDNGELSRKYQTLVTPNSSAFIIWAVIFLAQGAFALLQLLPRFRATDMLQQGLGYWYNAVALTQIGWTFAFAYEVIWLSLVFMISIWICLISILYSQYYTKSDGSLWEFWVLRFPFAIHAGWITAASALNVNVQVVDMNAAPEYQLAVAIVSLAVLHAISVWVLFKIERPNWTIACVLSWAFGYIYKELNEAENPTNATFSEDTKLGVMYAAIAVCFIILLQIVVRLGLLFRPTLNPYKKASEEETVGSGEEEVGLVDGEKE